jgi:methylmalonyl-CoA mutase cobalamin-binding subunit
VLGKHVPALGFIEVLMTDEPALPADVSYYQRLLASDPVEGADILGAYLAGHPLEEAYDDILVPALSRAKRDREAKRVSDEEAQAIYQTARETIEKLAAHRASTAGGGEDGSKPRIGDSIPQVLGCAAGDEADEIALFMLRQLVSPADCVIEITAAQALSGEIVSLAAEKKPSVVLIAALPPEGQAQARHLCKRLRARFPAIKILVGRWGGVHGSADRDLLLAAGADEVGPTLRQSRDQLLERVRLG